MLKERKECVKISLFESAFWESELKERMKFEIANQTEEFMALEKGYQSQSLRQRGDKSINLS